MDKQTIYTLTQNDTKRLFLSRNGMGLICPFNPGNNCGSWCPAFDLLPEDSRGITYVRLHCFPSMPVYSITEGDK